MQCIQVHDVDAASTIHHALGELHAVNQWVYDHGVLVLRGHKVWVVRPVPSYWNLRPAQVLGNWGESGLQDPQRGLLLSDGGGAKESVVDWGLLCEGVLPLVVSLAKGSTSSSMSLESLDSSSFFFPFPFPHGLFFRLCL